LKKVIAIVGMPGSGKSVATGVAAREGFPVISMGDVIREEAMLRGLNPSPENIGRIMLELRDEEGDDAVARRCIPRIEAEKSNVVIVEGIRSMAEVEAFKRKYPDFILIGVHASPETRLRRLVARGREDDPRTLSHFRERDKRELQVGIGNAIAMADYMLVNEGDIEEFKEKVRKLLRRVIDENKGGDPSKPDRRFK